MSLTTREIAILIWLTVVLCTSFLNPVIRISLLGVLRAFGNWRIQVGVWILAIYTALVVIILEWVGLWDIGQLKNTFIWLIAEGIVTLIHMPNIREDKKFFREWVSDNLKLIVIVQFLVTFYTFGLIIELILQPVLFVLGVMKILADRNAKYERVAKLIDDILMLTGFIIVIRAASMIIADFSNFATFSTLRDFYTPIFLSLASLPFFFALHVFMTYERVFSVLRFSINDAKLLRHAKLQTLLAFGPQFALIERWNRYVGAHRLNSEEELKRSIRDVKNARHRETQPIKVPAINGWSPAAARTFLKTEGIETRDYHRLYDEWEASSPYLKIGSAIMPNLIAYYITGDELVASILRLILNVNVPEEAELAEQEFVSRCIALTRAAIPRNAIKITAAPFEVEMPPWRVSLTRRDWSGSIRNGYELEFCIEVPGTKMMPRNLASIINNIP